MIKTRYLQLLKQLTIKEIKQRYKDSFLGVLWILINPLAQLIIMSFVFSNLFGRSEIMGVPYPIFLFAGLLPWIYFSTSINEGANSLSKNSAIISKIFFPRRVFVESALLSKTVDFIFSSLIFIAMLFLYQTPFKLSMLLIFLLLPLQFIFTYSLMMVLSIINLYYRDVQYLLGIVLKLWFYLTPIIYTREFFPDRYQWIFSLNPVSVLINSYREVLLGEGDLNYLGLGLMTIMIATLFSISWIVFHKAEKVVADVL